MMHLALLLALLPQSERTRPNWIWTEPNSRPWLSPFFGSMVGAVGDVDCDGVRDLLVGDIVTPSWSVREKRSFERNGDAWVLSGRDGAVLHHVVGPYGADQNGLSCADLGDVDGDACDDYILGWYEGVEQRSGFAELRSGRSGERLWFMRGPAEFARFVANAGDVDGDGRNDIVLAGEHGSSLATIRSGADGAVLRSFGALPGSRQAAGNPLVISDATGRGRTEIALLAADDSSGCAVLNVFGRDDARFSRSFELEFGPGRGRMNRFSLSLVRVNRADGAPHLLAACSTSELCIASVITGNLVSTRARDPRIEFRSAVASPGDLDADGFDDLWIGIDNQDVMGGGCVYARSGRDDRELYTFGDSERDQAWAYRIGATLVVAGDIDGDGVRDGLVGCDHWLARGDSGMAFAFSGRTGDLIFAFTRDGDGVRTTGPGARRSN